MDSSLVVGPPTVGRPLRLRPFRGWRLSPGRVGDPATARLFARPYRHVADRLARWRADGQLLEDPSPALYVHEYTAGGLTVRGLVGVLDLSRRARAEADRAVLPHEGVHPDQVAELAERMATWELDPAPILLVHRGPARVRELVDRTLGTPPLREYVDRADQHHRVWSLSAPPVIAEINDALAGSQALIADGHHRFAAYLRMHQQDPGPTTDRGLVRIVDQADTPLFIGAIHRVLSGVTLEEIAGASPPGVRFEPLAADQALAALAPDTLVVTDGVGWAALRIGRADDRAAVEVLHQDLLAPMGLAPRRITFRHSVDDALAKVRASRDVAVLMPAPEFDEVVRVAKAGRVLPEKATSFQPKPSVGVLMRSLHDE